METKPVLYGETTVQGYQDYALTTYSLEDIKTETKDIYKYKAPEPEPEELPEEPVEPEPEKPKEEEPKAPEPVEKPEPKKEEPKKLPVTGM